MRILDPFGLHWYSTSFIFIPELGRARSCVYLFSYLSHCFSPLEGKGGFMRRSLSCPFSCSRNQQHYGLNFGEIVDCNNFFLSTDLLPELHTQYTEPNNEECGYCLFLRQLHRTDRFQVEVLFSQCTEPVSYDLFRCRCVLSFPCFFFS